MNIGVKRIIALMLVVGYVGYIGYGMISGKVVPDGYVGIVGMVVGYYFGRGNNKVDLVKE